MKNLSPGDIFFGLLGFGLIALAFEFWPVTLAGILIYVFYRAYALYIGSESVQERIQQKRTRQLYEKVLDKYGDLQNPDSAKDALISWASKIYQALPRTYESIDDELAYTLQEIFYYEDFHPEIPSPPEKANSLEGARYRDLLSRIDTHGFDEHKRKIAQECTYDALQKFLSSAPTIRQEISWGTTSLSAFLDVPESIEAICQPFYRLDARENGVFTKLREQLDRNLCEASGIPYTTENAYSDKAKLATQNIDLVNPVYAYLKDTPLQHIFYTPVPVSVQEKDRWEHHWIVAATGHGKTQTLSSLILDDLERVQQNQCSLVVIDSNAKLIAEIAHLEIFAKGGKLEERLILIDPQDDLPLALNLFDLGISQFASLPKSEQDKLYNTTIEIYEYILSALIGADMTQKQGTLFRYVIRLLLSIPKANINTFLELMSPHDADQYKVYMDQLEGTAHTFFKTHFFEGEFKRSRPEVHRRLLGLLANTSFEAMFGAQENKLRLHEELAQGKVILINTAKTHLGDEASRVFGRFFIGLVWQATKKRFEETDPLPAYVYIDEAVEYFDDHIGALLRQARKSRVGLIMAHQDFEGVPDGVLAALRTNASIRMAGGIESPYDLKRVSNTMGLDSDLINTQPKASFATSVRGGITNASIQFELGRLSNEPKMSESEFDAIKTGMREKYYYQPNKQVDSTLRVAEPEAEYAIDEDPMKNSDPGDFLD